MIIVIKVNIELDHSLRMGSNCIFLFIFFSSLGGILISLSFLASFMISLTAYSFVICDRALFEVIGDCECDLQLSSLLCSFYSNTRVRCSCIWRIMSID